MPFSLAIRRRILCAVGFLLTASAAHAQAQSDAQQEGWAYELIPFLWAAGIDGREGVGDTTAAVSADFKDLVDFLNVGGALRMTASRPPLGWYAEASYVSLGGGANTPLGSLHLSSNQTLLEAGLSFQMVEKLALYAGLRYQDVGAVLEGNSRRLDQDRGWVDAIGGARWDFLANDHWVGWLRADAGGGGSRFVWLGEAGAGYRWGSRWGAYLSYRILDTDYRHDGFIYDIRMSGLLFGFGIRL
ncbi:MAG TPA: hypothetical protein VGM84_13850 [Steroidobacteraceae bacterium]|jgi:hypothetical protein